jgi:negative regulator of flagellin synthesis FlgM
VVQSIGPKPLSSNDRPVASVSRIAAAAKTVARGDDLAAAPQLSGVAAEAAAQAPVDTARVAALRAQIQNGSYTIDPDAIASRMLALKQEWTSK